MAKHTRIVFEKYREKKELMEHFIVLHDHDEATSRITPYKMSNRQ